MSRKTVTKAVRYTAQLDREKAEHVRRVFDDIETFYHVDGTCTKMNSWAYKGLSAVLFELPESNLMTLHLTFVFDEDVDWTEVTHRWGVALQAFRR